MKILFNYNDIYAFYCSAIENDPSKSNLTFFFRNKNGYEKNTDFNKERIFTKDDLKNKNYPKLPNKVCGNNYGVKFGKEDNGNYKGFARITIASDKLNDNNLADLDNAQEMLRKIKGIHELK